MTLAVYKKAQSDSRFEVTPFSPAWRWLKDEELRLLSSAGATARVYWSAHHHLAHCTAPVPERSFTLCSRGFIAAVMCRDAGLLRMQLRPSITSLRYMCCTLALDFVGMFTSYRASGFSAV